MRSVYPFNNVTCSRSISRLGYLQLFRVEELLWQTGSVPLSNKVGSSSRCVARKCVLLDVLAILLRTDRV